jgi:hypothetical protein
MKKCSMVLSIEEIQIKITLRFHVMPIRMANIKKINNNKCWWGCSGQGGKEPSCAIGIWSTATMEISEEVPQKTKSRATLWLLTTVEQYPKECKSIYNRYLHECLQDIIQNW